VEINSKSIWYDNQEDQLIKSLDKSSMVSITDPKGIIIYVNDTFCKESGYDEQELLGQNHRILKSGKQTDGLYKGLWKTISSKKIWRGELCNKKKDDSFYWVNVTIIPFFDNHGNIEKYVAIRFDITTSKENIEHLKAAQNKFALLFDSAPDAYFISDLDGLIKNCNTAAEKMSGYTKKELINGYITNSDLLSKTDRTFFINSLKIPSKKSKKFEFQITTKQGKVIIVEIISHHATIDGENVVLHIAHDITKRKTTLNKLKEKTEDLELFLYRSSHDLRAPYTSLEGLVNLMKQEVLNESTKDLLEMFNQTLKTGKILVDNLATASEILNKSIKNETVDFNELINQTIKTLEHLDGFKNISFNINIPKELKFYSNSQMLSSILQTILQNAIKYQRPINKTHTPFIIINALKTKEGIKISIKDNGMGIKKDEEDKIFDLYYRSNHTVDGAGLGLYITKNAVEKLNGTITAKSTINKETQFDILLPNLYKI
jgi:PAS domain S-box-containing protein